MKKTCIVCQSGGPTAVINSSLAGVISASLTSKHIDQILGSVNGITGIINDKLIDLSKQDEEDINLLLNTPGAALGSARFLLSTDFDDENYQKIAQTIAKYNVGYIIFIGGNDSMDSVNKLSMFAKEKKIGINVIGVPKTIDNDLVEIDHTPGYGSAIKYIATTIAEVKIDMSSYDKGRVTIVEIMGRGAGWLTAGAKLADLTGYGADLIYLPESPFDIDEFLNDVKKTYEKNQKVLVAVSEGIKDKEGEYIFKKNQYVKDNDVFGHINLEGTAVVLADIVHQKLNYPVRNIILNLPQRCASHIASKTDINEAFNCGVAAVNVCKDNTGKMITMINASTNGYSIEYKIVDVNKVANYVKQFPQEWIVNRTDISDEFVDYALPLIQGEVDVPYENGLPMFSHLKK